MTESDAKELLATADPEWDMPDEWWQIETEGMSFHVDEATALKVLGVAEDQWSIVCIHNSNFYEFTDIYGARCYTHVNSVEGVFKSTPLARAKWITGIPKRNWKSDEKPEWDS